LFVERPDEISEMSGTRNLTHERLTEVLSADPATGVFRWRVRPSNRVHVGDRAGVVGVTGHRFITIDGEKLLASRLAWFYAHGVWPTGDIKMLNGNPDDCSLANLRAGFESHEVRAIRRTSSMTDAA
jgi:hypothetical protein